MSTVHYRYDYAKFVITCLRGQFHYSYRSLCDASEKIRCAGTWDAHNKVSALYSMDPDFETTVVQIWGEWAGVVEYLTSPLWWGWLKRLDVRAVVWDADADAVLYTGQALQRSDIGYNVNVYNTKPASKREGRSRGGKGFAIGSHKSDLRVTVYKRTGEPVACEYQCQGDMLKRLVVNTLERHDSSGDYAYATWAALKQAVQAVGEARLSKSLENAGIGTYWPTYGPHVEATSPPLQASFAAPLAPDEEAELYRDAPWQDTEPPNA